MLCHTLRRLRLPLTSAHRSVHGVPHVRLLSPMLIWWHGAVEGSICRSLVNDLQDTASRSRTRATCVQAPLKRSCCCGPVPRPQLPSGAYQKAHSLAHQWPASGSTWAPRLSSASELILLSCLDWITNCSILKLPTAVSSNYQLQHPQITNCSILKLTTAVSSNYQLQ